MNIAMNRECKIKWCMLQCIIWNIIIRKKGEFFFGLGSEYQRKQQQQQQPFAGATPIHMLCSISSVKVNVWYIPLYVCECRLNVEHMHWIAASQPTRQMYNIEICERSTQTYNIITIIMIIITTIQIKIIVEQHSLSLFHSISRRITVVMMQNVHWHGH